MSRFTLLTCASVLVLSTLISGCGRDDAGPQENQADSVDDTNVIVPASSEGLEADPNASLEEGEATEEGVAEGEITEGEGEEVVAEGEMTEEGEVGVDIVEGTEEVVVEGTEEVVVDVIEEESTPAEEPVEVEVVTVEEVTEEPEPVAEVAEEPEVEEIVVEEVEEIVVEEVVEVEVVEPAEEEPVVAEETVEEETVIEEEPAAEEAPEEVVAMSETAEPIETVVPAPVIEDEEVTQPATTPPAEALSMMEGDTTMVDIPALATKTRGEAETALESEELAPIFEAQDSIDAALEQAYAVVARMQNVWTQDQYVAFIEESQITSLQNLRRRLSDRLGTVAHRKSFAVSQ